jgi:hypothetical protein
VFEIIANERVENDEADDPYEELGKLFYVH